tara:strand:+ start:291 stop:443 length:153 start_codon:yes stop_codon:yes gene_type:complete
MWAVPAAKAAAEMEAATAEAREGMAAADRRRIATLRRGRGAEGSGNSLPV